MIHNLLAGSGQRSAALCMNTLPLSSLSNKKYFLLQLYYSVCVCACACMFMCVCVCVCMRACVWWQQMSSHCWADTSHSTCVKWQWWTAGSPFNNSIYFNHLTLSISLKHTHTLYLSLCQKPQLCWQWYVYMYFTIMKFLFFNKKHRWNQLLGFLWFLDAHIA